MDHEFDYRKGVLHVHFRPDGTPETKAQWFESLGNLCHTYSELLNNIHIHTETSTNDDTHTSTDADKDNGIYILTTIIHDIDTTLEILEQLTNNKDVELSTVRRKI